MKTKKVLADALRNAGEWVDGTFVYRHVAAPAVEARKEYRVAPLQQGPTIAPYVPWVEDLSGGLARYPIPDQSTNGGLSFRVS